MMSFIRNPVILDVREICLAQIEIKGMRAIRIVGP